MHNILSSSVMNMFTHPKKKINQNKVILTATIIQSQHCRSCQKRFMSTAVVSHEVAFFTKMSHKLLSATALGVCANIIPCGSVFFFVFFSWQWFWMKGAVCLDASGPKAWVHRAGSRSRTSSMCLIDFQSDLGSFHCHWITFTKNYRDV